MRRLIRGKRMRRWGFHQVAGTIFSKAESCRDALDGPIGSFWKAALFEICASDNLVDFVTRCFRRYITWQSPIQLEIGNDSSVSGCLRV